MDYQDLTDEQKAKMAACETPDEMLALAREEGIELTDEQLEQVEGGWGGGSQRTCPFCGSDDVMRDGDLMLYTCFNCGTQFA